MENGGFQVPINRTPATVIFYVSTLLFALFSLLGLYTAFRSFGKPVGRLDRVFALLFSFACFGMTLYLYYYDSIGLKMWCY